jgi:hypothetical protein
MERVWVSDWKTCYVDFLFFSLLFLAFYFFLAAKHKMDR